MANSLLTMTAVTRESLAVLHQKCNFIGSMNRDYDGSHAREGAKIGDTLKVRRPNEFVTRSGLTMNAQDTDETSVDLTIDEVLGVDLEYGSLDLTLSMESLRERTLEPAMARLAAKIESTVINKLYKLVPYQVSALSSGTPTYTADLNYVDVQRANQVLTENLAPYSQRTANLTPAMHRTLVADMKGLFNPQAQLGEQFRDGMIGAKTGGFDQYYENTLWPTFTSGSDDGTGDYLTDIAAGEADGTAGLLHIDTGAGTFKAGDIITIANVFDVHHETKDAYSHLKPFVVTADYAGGEGDLAISPSIVTSGGRQNVSAAAADGAAITKVQDTLAGTALAASKSHPVALAYHRDAFLFATADLALPEGQNLAARAVMDGISLSLIGGFDITTRKFPYRFDVAFGSAVYRESQACRIVANGTA